MKEVGCKKGAQKFGVEGTRVMGQEDAHSRGIGKSSAEEVRGRGILMALRSF